MTRRPLFPMGLLICSAILCATAAPVSANEISAYNNRPKNQVFTPNDKVAQNRKQAMLHQWRQLQQQVDLLREDEGISPAPRPAYKVLDVIAERQVCKEYCGPAATRAILSFSGNGSLSQAQIANLEGTGPVHRPVVADPATQGHAWHRFATY